MSGDTSPSIDVKVGLNPTSIEDYDFPEKMKKLTGKIGIMTGLTMKYKDKNGEEKSKKIL